MYTWEACMEAGTLDAAFGKGANGASTNGVGANFFMFFDRGTFWVLPSCIF